MNIPKEIIEVAQSLPNPTQRGLFYCAAIEYMHDGTVPEYKIGREAHSLFVISMPMLDFYREQNQ